MILSIPLQPGTLLANVRYKFVIGTTEGAEHSTGITQPDINFAVFLFNVTLPENVTEVIAYDATDLTNWNVAGLQLLAQQAAAAVSPVQMIAMSTPYRVPFKRVFDSVARLHGLNPKQTQSSDIADSLLEHINARVESIALGWTWPEWDVTEERAFRQVWSEDRQFYRVNIMGVPDEVFYIPTTSYWKVDPDALSDPTLGVPPSATTDGWLELSPVDTYVAYNQTCKRAIGQVLGVYGRDPRLSPCCNGSLLRYHPSEKGIDICNPSGPTVFILYQMPVPNYSMTPFIVGRTYSAGEVILDIITGECFQAIDTTLQSPAENLAVWRHVPFLQKWFNFVRWGAYADSLGEIDQGGTIDPNTQSLKAANAENKANLALQQQVDSLVMQGQELKWHFKRHGFWCESQPWSGGSVTTLTDACETSTGMIFPQPPPAVGCDTSYHSEIVAVFSVDGTPSLEGLATTTRNVTCTLINIVIVVEGTLELQSWRLDTGPADLLNPGELVPADYNAVSNDKHWTKVG